MSEACATTMVWMDLAQQAEESTSFVSATVGRSRVVVTDRMVYTDTELHVAQVLGGRAPSTIVVRQAGGELPDRTIRVPGDARLNEGEVVLAFVRNIQSKWYFTALGQSVWHLEGEQLVRELDGELMQRSPDGRIVPLEQSPRELDTFEMATELIPSLWFGGAL